jgi:predicted alpha/beta-fold hydrolase
MDFNKLLEPYSENGRTLAGQIKWLAKQGFPQASIDYAVSFVYKKLDLGGKFENGHELDQELRRVTKRHFESELETQMKKRIGELESNLDAEWNKLTKFQKIKEVLTGRA